VSQFLLLTFNLFTSKVFWFYCCFLVFMLRFYFAVVIFPGNFSFGFIAEHWYIILAEWLMIKRLAEMQKHELRQEIQNPELNIYLFCRPWPLFWSTTFCFPHLFKIMRHLRLKWISCHKNSSSCQISWKICQLHVRGSEFGCLWICQHDWCFLPDDIGWSKKNISIYSRVHVCMVVFIFIGQPCGEL